MPIRNIIARAPHDDEGSTAGDHTEDGEVIGNTGEDRLAKLSAIADSHEREIEDQLANVNDDDTTEPFVAAKGEQEEVIEEEAAAEEAAPTPEPVAALPKIKVNGEDVELTPELIAKAQKIASGDKYLEDAVATRKGVTAPPEPAPATREPDVDLEQVRRDEDLALVRALQVGNEEEALAAVRKIRENSRINGDQIAAIADERLNFKQALSWFAEEYKDLYQDPQLRGIVESRDADLVAKGDRRSYRERYEAVGNEVREWVQDMTKKFAPPPPAKDTLETKQERKAAAPSAPKPAAGKAPQRVNDDESGPEDTHSVIAQMAKARGGPQWQRA